MASNDSAPNLLFKENSKENFLAACDILLRLANNVLENPDENKYRRIRISNPLLESKLLPVVGGMECLFEMGFTEDGEYLTLPANSSLRVLRQVRNEIYDLSKSARAAGDGPSAQSPVGADSQVRSDGSKSATTSHPASSNASTTVSSFPVDSGARPKTSGTTSAAANNPERPQPQTVAPGPRISPIQSQGAAATAQPTQTIRDLKQREVGFARRIHSSLAHVMMYEDPSLQEKARSIIPVAKLKEEADARLGSPEEPFKNVRGANPPDLNDCVLLELLNWFKKSFFRWVDSPPCDYCGGTTHHAGSADPTSQELRYGGSRVENHQCDSCRAFTRFPRYNDPGKLLETRRGRCGEWANCFTLCCRALGFEARYVLDWTDHVWTEVYSQSQKRWLHCDPCENTCDKPLLYENGWGKKLTYVIAFSKDEVQDVTWRYSAKHAEVLSRRHECREPWLVSLIHTISKHKQQAIPEPRRQIILQRLVVEMVEFMTPHKEGQQNLPGRTTGSLAWREARGETGKAATPTLAAEAPSAPPQRQYTFRLLQEEKHSEVVHIQYSCAQDVYKRMSAQEITTPKWHSCCISQFMFRKEENDWKMAYLARDEGAEVGEIQWIFDLTGEDLRMNKLELKASSTVFEDGKVSWVIRSDDLEYSVLGPELENFKTFDLEGGRTLKITATLSGGQSDNAWQHAQLFRQKLDDEDYPFEIVLHLG